MKISLYKSASTKTANGDVITQRELLSFELEIEQLIARIILCVFSPCSLSTLPALECSEVI